MGPTSLAFGETDVVEYPGCALDDNNFLAPIEASQGDSYTMLVNNCSSLREAEDFSLFEIAPALSSGQITIQLNSERHVGASKLQFLQIDLPPFLFRDG